MPRLKEQLRSGANPAGRHAIGEIASSGWTKGWTTFVVVETAAPSLGFFWKILNPVLEPMA
jgi:hypothetical protein